MLNYMILHVKHVDFVTKITKICVFFMKLEQKRSVFQ